jgi:hypothetical protein
MIVDVKTGQNCWSWDVFDPAANPMCSADNIGRVMSLFPGFSYYEAPARRAA